MGVVADALERAPHFRKPKGSTDPAPAQPAPTAPGVPAAARPTFVHGLEVPDGESYGLAIVRRAQEQPRPTGDPRMNPAMPFGLGRVPK
jgi:hypothetical protein